jgi:hypothetical protein
MAGGPIADNQRRCGRIDALSGIVKAEVIAYRGNQVSRAKRVLALASSHRMATGTSNDVMELEAIEASQASATPTRTEKEDSGKMIQWMVVRV